MNIWAPLAGFAVTALFIQFLLWLSDRFPDGR